MKKNKTDSSFIFVICIWIMAILSISVLIAYHYGNSRGSNDFQTEFPINNKMATCEYPYYEVVYVTELNTNRCYATKNNNHFYMLKLKESMNLTYNPDSYFKVICWDCTQAIIINRGKLYCLENKTKCLSLEDNDRICNIIDLYSESLKGGENGN